MISTWVTKLKLVLIALLGLAAYYPTFKWMIDRYEMKGSHYSHGYLIPVVSLFLAWKKREVLKSLPLSSSKAGAFLLVLGLGLHLVALQFEIHFISGFSFIISLSGLLLFLTGSQITKALLFPLFFLIFMIPLPSVLIIYTSVKLKIMAAYLAAKAVSLMGLPAQATGSIIHLPQTEVVVGDPCSGMRSLLSLLALGALFAYLLPLSYPRRFLMFVSTIPIALISNLFRIMIILFIAHTYGLEVATGKYHQVYGLLVFVMAFIGLAMVGKLLRLGERKDRQ